MHRNSHHGGGSSDACFPLPLRVQKSGFFKAADTPANPTRLHPVVAPDAEKPCARCHWVLARQGSRHQGQAPDTPLIQADFCHVVLERGRLRAELQVIDGCFHRLEPPLEFFFFSTFPPVLLTGGVTPAACPALRIALDAVSLACISIWAACLWCSATLRRPSSTSAPESVRDLLFRSVAVRAGCGGCRPLPA